MNWVRTGDFKFTVSRARGGRMRIWLTESRKKRTARSLSVGAEMTFGGVRQSLAPLLKEISELPDRPSTASSRRTQKPGKLFRDRLRARLKVSDPALRALIDVAAGGGKPAARRLVNSLIDATVASGRRQRGTLDRPAGRANRPGSRGCNPSCSGNARPPRKARGSCPQQAPRGARRPQRVLARGLASGAARGRQTRYRDARQVR